MSNDAHLMTTAEVAEALGVSVATVNRWAAHGKLAPYLRAPGGRGANMFTVAEVERLRAEVAA